MSILILFCTMIGAAIIYGISHINNLQVTDAFDLIKDENNISTRNFVRSIVMVNHLTMFVLPSILFAFVLYRPTKKIYFQIAKSPKLINILLGTLLIISSFPLAQFTMWINKQLPLPEWAKSVEKDTAEMINALLTVDSSYELFFNIVVVAVIPAIGEELIFRGILQRQLGRLFKNSIVAIWTAAIIFSAFHMQFEGFLPRLMLGALLGYLLYWTNNIWIPIIVHFMYNGLQVIAQHFYSEQFSNIDLEEAMNQISWGPALISFLLILVLSNALIKFNRQIIP